MINVISIIRPLCIPLVLIIWIATFKSFHEGDATFVTMSVLVACYVLGLGGHLLFSALRMARRQDWTKVLSKVLAGMLLVPTAYYGVRAGDLIHFVLKYRDYATAVAQPHPENQNLVRFDWGDAAMFVTDGSRPVTLVYDRTGLTKDLIDPSYDNCLVHDFRHLIGKWYVDHGQNTQC